MTKGLTIPKFGVHTFIFIIYIYRVCGTGTGDCCCMNECYNIVVAVKGGDCCCMNECYNIVVAVKVATAVV